MKLSYSSTSPYWWKCQAVLRALGLGSRVELQPIAQNEPFNGKFSGIRSPAGDVLEFVSDDGALIFDSKIICEYLDAQSECVTRAPIFPVGGASRWARLCEQSCADAIIYAVDLLRHEDLLPKSLFRCRQQEIHFEAIRQRLIILDVYATKFNHAAHIGEISCASALRSLDVFYPDFGWRRSALNAASWYDQFTKFQSQLFSE